MRETHRLGFYQQARKRDPWEPPERGWRTTEKRGWIRNPEPLYTVLVTPGGPCVTDPKNRADLGTTAHTWPNRLLV